MEQLRIELISSNGVYFPGQIVAGNAYIRLKDAIKARCVTISIIGKAQTKWVVTESRSNGDGKSSSSVNVTYSSEVIYIDQEIHLWTSSNDSKKLAAGQYQYPFSFSLPISLPPTFEGRFGYIRYYLKLKIDRPWHFDDSCKVPFTVTPHFDLNTINYAGLPAIQQDSKDLGIFLFKHGQLNVKAMLSKVGYVPGESIVLQLEIDNASSRDVTKIESSLIQCAVYKAKRYGGRFNIGFNCGYSRFETRERCLDVACFKEHFKVCKNSKGVYQKTFNIPPTSPSFNICPIIVVSYYLNIKVTADGKISNTLTLEIPILIGTIPVRTTSTGQSVDFPANIAPPMPSAPPAYEDSQMTYGTCELGEKNTDTDDQEERIPDYAPKYIYYPNLSLK